MPENKKGNDEDEPVTFRENDSFEIPKVFPLSFLNHGAFLSPMSYEKCRLK